MRLSKKSEYAILALIDLSTVYGTEQIVRISDIAERNDIPKRFLEQILMTLKRTGYVDSIRGRDGGYCLIRSPQNIHLAEVIRILDGPLAPVDSVSEFFYKATPIENNEKLLKCFKDIRDYTVHKLENITFQDLI